MAKGKFAAMENPKAYTPTVEDVRDEWCYGIQDVDMDGHVVVSFREAGEQFDRWLAEHDHQVRVEYESLRNPSPILIENVDSQPAGAWLAEHDAQLIEKLAEGINGRSGGQQELWLREQAQARREQA